MDQTSSSAPSITAVDISGPARALALLRWSDYLLVVVCGLGAASVAADVIRALVEAQWVDALTSSAFAAVFTFAAYTGWRHVGVIDPRVWRSYLLLFPLIVLLAAFIGFGLLLNWQDEGVNPLANAQSLVMVFALLQFAAVFIPGFACVLYLKRTRLSPGGARLPDVLTQLWKRGGTSGLKITNQQRINTRRGLAYGGLGALILVVGMAIPIPEGQQASAVFRLTEQLDLFAFFLIVRARRYFQVSADALLAVDKRPPILFLRSFADDEKQRYGTSRRALLDFSLETRLANHFHRFGPFIAIESPTDSIPQPGAARVRLGDDEWQGRVLGWIREANLILMYCGTTAWVSWELRQVIENGRATSLILMFPEIRTWRRSKRNQDIGARTEQIRQAFRDTPWNEELIVFDDYPGLRAMLFREDGSMVMIRSTSRSRDAYHLAALLAHQSLIDPKGALLTTTADEAPRRAPRWVFAGGAATLALALIGSVYLFAPAGDARLTFKQGELYYADPVTEEDARKVGEHLVQQEFFSDDHASTVQLHQEEGRYQLRFVVNPDHLDDPLTSIQFGVVGSQIAREVLGGRSMDVALADPTLETVKAVPPSGVVEYGNSALFFTNPVAESDARAVGGVLAESGFFTDERPSVVHMGWEDAAFHLRFVVDESRAKAPETLNAFSELGAALSAEVLGSRPVVVHICDERFRTVQQAPA
ncbi:MAG: hypothetical protein ABW292_04985 [Vicinamibacterales bacterium]